MLESGAGGGNEELSLNGYWVSVLWNEKNSGDGWCWWLCNDVNEVRTVELRLKMAELVKFMCILPQFKKLEKTHKTVINILKYKYIELYNNRKRTINDREG